MLPIGTGRDIAGADSLDYPINKTAILEARSQGGVSIEAHGTGANHELPQNAVHGLTDSLDQIDPIDYYRLLDCGFQLPLTNGSDHPARVAGCARAYVQIEGDFDYEKWIDGIRNGKTFTTSGPLIFLEVNGQGPGAVLIPQHDKPLQATLKVISRFPLGNVQIVSNGEILKELQTDQTEVQMDCSIPSDTSRCIAAVTLSSDSPPVVHPRESLVELDEQGWRVNLVKVINPDRLRSPLRVDSPNAKPLPHAKPIEVASRWLGVSMIDSQPMTPGLTGLPLEYRLIELYAKEPGQKSVELAFAAPGGKPISKSRPSDSIYAQWRFDQDTSGWEQKNDIQLSVDQGALIVRGIGDDPFMQVTLPETLSPGNFVLRIWGQSEESGIGQVFWWSDQRPLPDGNHVFGFNIEPGRQMLYEIPISESDRLAGVRIRHKVYAPRICYDTVWAKI